MVFVGNINQSVIPGEDQPSARPFPEAMIDAAFFDRFHAYVPGWEIPKMRPEFFTNQYGLIVDYLAEYLREMRKRNFADAIDKVVQAGQQPQPARHHRRAPDRLRPAQAHLPAWRATRRSCAAAWSTRSRPVAG